MNVAIATEFICFFLLLLIYIFNDQMKETINQWFSSNFNADKAEKYNGWAAMIGVISGIGAYAITGQIIPGVF